MRRCIHTLKPLTFWPSNVVHPTFLSSSLLLVAPFSSEVRFSNLRVAHFRKNATSFYSLIVFSGLRISIKVTAKPRSVGSGKESSLAFSLVPRSCVHGAVVKQNYLCYVLVYKQVALGIGCYHHRSLRHQLAPASAHHPVGMLSVHLE